MKRFVYITILGAALAMPGAMTADDLNKEITVEKDIVPQEREASRLTHLMANWVHRLKSSLGLTGP